MLACYPYLHACFITTAIYIPLNGFSINILVDYLDDLMQETIHQCEEGTSQSPQHIPKPLCSGYERSDMQGFSCEQASKPFQPAIKLCNISRIAVTHETECSVTSSLFLCTSCNYKKDYRSMYGYTKPAYCSEGNFFLIAIIAQLGNTTLTFLPQATPSTSQ